jgi:Ca-activated chloride channel family protein
MKRALLTLALMLLAASPSMAAGLMQPKDGSLPPLQIRDHRVNVVINNGFAITEVDQVFHNPNDIDLEAVYTFPLPKDASLSEVGLWVDDRELIGEVVEKKRARKIYEEERDAGRDTALAEQREYYAFDLFVSPIRAGEDTRVRLVYLQPLEIDLGVGRYVYPVEEGRIDEEMHSFWDVRPEVHGSFSFECHLRSSYPLEEVRLKGYEEVATVNQVGPDSWNARIEMLEGTGSLDRDIVVYYRLAQDLPARVDLLAHRDGEGPGTFLLIVTPGADLQEITEGVDWTVVLDTSGSMASKLATAADGVTRAIERMRPDDRFRIVVFGDRARYLVADWTPVTPASIEEVRGLLAGLQAGKSTNVYAGVELGLEDLDADRTTGMILISDGGANVGPTEYRDFRKLLEKHDVRVFTFVMGQGANRPLLGRIAEESGGFSVDVSNEDDLYGRILQAKAKLGREAMHGVRVELEGARVIETAPKRLPSAYHGQQIVLFGRYTKPAMAKLTLEARISGEDRHWETRVELPDHDDTYPELERMWALARVQDLQKQIDDGGDERELREAIVDLGTGFSIVTEHTSMIVVEAQRFEELGIDRKNERRVERERDARGVRAKQAVRPSRADADQPMFSGKSAPGLGGGAVGPGAVGLLVVLLGARWCLRRKDPS